MAERSGQVLGNDPNGKILSFWFHDLLHEEMREVCWNLCPHRMNLGVPNARTPDVA